MPTLGVVDVIASCLRAQLGAGTRRAWSDGQQDVVSVETLAQLVVVCLTAGGWVIMRRSDVFPEASMVLPQRGREPSRLRRVRRRSE